MTLQNKTRYIQWNWLDYFPADALYLGYIFLRKEQE